MKDTVNQFEDVDTDDWIEIDFDTIDEVGNAYMITVGNAFEDEAIVTYLPKSFCMYEIDHSREEAKLLIPEWLAVEKGLA